MDAQLKRGVLEICILSVLRRGDSYGYQIVKDTSPAVAISESTLYPILKRLEAGGCVTVYSVEHNGRLRKYYHITPAGEEKIESFLLQWQDLMKVYTFIAGGKNHEQS